MSPRISCHTRPATRALHLPRPPPAPCRRYTKTPSPPTPAPSIPIGLDWAVGRRIRPTLLPHCTYPRRSRVSLRRRRTTPFIPISPIPRSSINPRYAVAVPILQTLIAPARPSASADPLPPACSPAGAPGLHPRSVPMIVGRAVRTCSTRCTSNRQRSKLFALFLLHVSTQLTVLQDSHRRYRAEHGNGQQENQRLRDFRRARKRGTWQGQVGSPHLYQPACRDQDRSALFQAPAPGQTR